MGEAEFLRRLEEAIAAVGGSAMGERQARELARSVWGELGHTGPDDFPNLVQKGDLRFVCQWDETPPILTVMLWDGVMWRDVERIALPAADKNP
jgi:hypothetical protein